MYTPLLLLKKASKADSISFRSSQSARDAETRASTAPRERERERAACLAPTCSCLRAGVRLVPETRELCYPVGGFDSLRGETGDAVSGGERYISFSLKKNGDVCMHVWLSTRFFRARVFFVNEARFCVFSPSRCARARGYLSQVARRAIKRARKITGLNERSLAPLVRGALLVDASEADGVWWGLEGRADVSRRMHSFIRRYAHIPHTFQHKVVVVVGGGDVRTHAQAVRRRRALGARDRGRPLALLPNHSLQLCECLEQARRPDAAPPRPRKKRPAPRQKNPKHQRE